MLKLASVAQKAVSLCRGSGCGTLPRQGRVVLPSDRSEPKERRTHNPEVAGFASLPLVPPQNLFSTGSLSTLGATLMSRTALCLQYANLSTSATANDPKIRHNSLNAACVVKVHRERPGIHCCLKRNLGRFCAAQWSTAEIPYRTANPPANEL